jgi:SAM-dependent methyltransferase
MSLKGAVRNLLDSVVRPYGYVVADVGALYEWQRPASGPLAPRGRTDAYLTENNPRLAALRDRYAKCDSAVTAADLWKVDHIVGERLRYFRGNDAYVWQLRGPNMNVLGYALTTYYVRSIDSLGLLAKLTDDDWFGNFTFTLDGATVSRDVLDSLIELYFLERHLHLSSMSRPIILDVGAGYGRLAHRTCQVMPNVAEYLCVDAVPQSTFISEFYLKFRESKATVIALDEIEATLARTRPDIAVNVHSFSECRMPAIDWWLRLLSKSGVRHLMIVPNDARHDGGQTLVTNDGQDFSSLVSKYGYKLVVREPKYRDPTVQQYAINPTHHFLFELA